MFSKDFKLNLSLIVICTYLFLFTFGQLLRYELVFSGRLITIHPIDGIAFLSLFFFPFMKKFPISKYFYAFFLACLFSLLISFAFFKPITVFVGSLYFFRLFSYYSFFVIVYNLSGKSDLVRKNIIDLLIIVLFLFSIFGWIQYFYFFDLRFLKFAFWDDHLGRLVSTFLDPTFTGIVVVLGFFAVFLKYIESKKNIYLLSSLFFLLTLLFTYSRASFVSCVVGLLVILFLKRNAKFVFMFLALFLLAIPFLPRTKGEGVKLERTRSIVLRAKNYQETFEIIKSAPLFGVGFNNICAFRVENYSDSIESHACSGSDSSLLFVFATTGIVGLLMFIKLLLVIYQSIGNDYFGVLTKTFFVSLFFHSFFSNSLFYPFILGILAILLGVSLKQ